MTIYVPTPIIHEFDSFFKFNDDLKIQQAFIGLVKRHGTPYSIGSGSETITVTSQLGQLINPATDKQSWEYRVSVGDPTKNEASKFHLHIAGQFGPCKTASGGFITRPFVGTQIRVECSYYDIDAIWLQFNNIFSKLKIGKNHLQTFHAPESPILQMAWHIRYHHLHEAEVCHILGELGELSRSTGTYSGHDFWDHRDGGVAMRKVDIEDLGMVGIDCDYALGGKSYRLKNFKDRQESDPLFHPKLEVMYLNKLTKSSGREQPTMEDYDILSSQIQETLFNLIHWGQVTTTIPDDYFTGERMECPIQPKKNILADVIDTHLNRADTAVYQTNNNELRFLRAICDGNTIPKHIATELDLSIKTVRKMCHRYVDKGILVHKYNNICFLSRAIRERAGDAISRLHFVIGDNKAPVPQTDEIDRYHPEYFERKYTPVLKSGFKHWYLIYDAQKVLDRKEVRDEYEFHLQLHGIMFGEKLPAYDGSFHRIQIIPHGRKGTVPAPIIVTSKREQNAAYKEMRANNAFRRVLRVSPIVHSSLHLAD